MADENKKANEALENEDVEDQNTEETGTSEEDKSGNKGGNNEGSKETGKDDKTFTQEQVTRMMTREKNQGRNAVYKELGIDPKNAGQLKQVKAYLDSLKTDEEKAKQAEDEKNNALTEANQRAQVAEAKAEAMMLGIKKQYVDDAVTLALSKMTEDSDLKTIIGELKTKYPIWFGESDEKDDKGKVGQKGTGSSVKSAEKGGKKDEKGLGARLAAQRKTGSGKKSSYWGNH